ncbi:MAG: hypothetical protein M0R22_05905 [Dehalococcoidia bacterium]|jgi:hypothetical protein|nr:hypothetical protein [Dehalococcoidia bacterium]
MTIEKKPESFNEEESAEPTQTCGPGCNCGKTGSGGKGKAIVAVAVLVVAAVLLARGLMAADEASDGRDEDSFGAIVTQGAGVPPSLTTAGDSSRSSLWGEPLGSIGDLDTAAASYVSVFVYLPGAEAADASIRSEIEAAARKAQAQGLTTGLFILSDESDDYAAIADQVPAPCVVALVRGGCSSVVSGDITETTLLEALVSASRPSSGCGPAGCAPGGC